MDIKVENLQFIDIGSDEQTKKVYSPPVLLKLEDNSIDGGISALQEPDGFGFVS